MKKVCALLLALILALSLVGCGHDYSKHMIDYFTEAEGFSWDMTVEDAKALIGDLQKDAGYSRDIEVKDYETFVSVTDKTYTIRFDEKGKVDLVKQKVPSGIDGMLSKAYGEWDEAENGSLIWYGTMADHHTRMTLDKKRGYIEFVPEN